VAAELWDDRLFEHHTLGDLSTRGRPWVYINATDMDAGSVFSFTQDQLDALCIRADTFPIARAVAASSAVPGALSPVTIRNYGAGRPCAPPASWIALALRGDSTSDSYRYAKTLLSYREAGRKYVHLLDGGLADNLGARVPLRLLTTSGEEGSILDRLRAGGTSTTLFVVVDAARVTGIGLGQHAEIPSMVRALYKSADIPFGNYSWETLRRLRDQAATIGAGVAEVTFRNVSDSAALARLEKLGTTFELPIKDVDLLRATGASLIEREQMYRRLLRDYDIKRCR
jgi:NTE family protein